MTRQLALMGGTFDPIHMGHLKVAQSIYEALHFEKIVFCRPISRLINWDRVLPRRLTGWPWSSWRSSDYPFYPG
jgi:FAD synthase